MIGFLDPHEASTRQLSRDRFERRRCGDLVVLATEDQHIAATRDQRGAIEQRKAAGATRSVRAHAALRRRAHRGGGAERVARREQPSRHRARELRECRCIVGARVFASPLDMPPLAPTPPVEAQRCESALAHAHAISETTGESMLPP